MSGEKRLETLFLILFFVIGTAVGLVLAEVIERPQRVNHPEGAVMYPVYLKGSKLYMGHVLFERAVQCAKTPDACQDVEQLDQPAERVLGGKK